mgnify:CR=1 FL=1
MKIEKVNDHQIRCTLTKEDLADREIKLSELAYGTDKAKDLFRDMMQQASFEFGFEAEDIPLMIEAIPLNADCIVLIITKVEDPDELDTRFSKFAPSVHEDGGDLDEIHGQLVVEGDSLMKAMNQYVKTFISDNYENVLGPSVFMMLCSSLPYPIMTPQIDDIIKDAPYSFKDNKLVREFLSKARENMKLIEEHQRLEQNASTNK